MTYIIKNKRFKDRARPELTLGIDSTVRFQFVNDAGEPIPLGMTDVFTVAVDSNFIHTDSLMAYSSNVFVMDADNGIIEVVISCNTTGFESKLNGRERIQAWIEVARYEAGSANAEVLLQDTCSAYNRVQYNEAEPQPDDPLYYTAAQVDALLAYKAISLAACSGLGEILEENAFTMTWIDPDDVTLNGATLAEWNQTVLVRKVGSYPADHTDGTVIATTSRELGNKNAYRSTGFTDSERESGTTYYYKLFSQTTAGVWNNLTGNQFVENTDMSWGMVQAFVRAGRGPELFPVGTVFEVEHPEYTHTNGQGLLFRVSGHDQVPAADESLTHTMCLELVDCLFSAPYDSAEAFYALTADTTAQRGKDYYVYENSAYTKLVDGTDYDVGDPVPVAEWYEKNPIEQGHGKNDVVQSNMMQWLNSSGAAGEWFTKQNIWDVCGSTLLNKNGFLRYIDPEFLAVVQPAKLISMKYNSGGVIHSARFWGLSVTQLYGTANGGVMENEQLQYYVNGSKTKALYNGDGSSVNWHLRSIRAESSTLVLNVNSNGSSTSIYAQANSAYSPACIIA